MRRGIGLNNMMSSAKNISLVPGDKVMLQRSKIIGGQEWSPEGLQTSQAARSRKNHSVSLQESMNHHSTLMPLLDQQKDLMMQG